MLVKGKIKKIEDGWRYDSELLNISLVVKERRNGIGELEEFVRFHLNIEDEIEAFENGSSFFIKIKDVNLLCSMILRGSRNTMEKPQSQVAKELSLKSKSGYSEYETGKKQISVSQFDRFLSAINNRDLVISLM